MRIAHTIVLLAAVTSFAQGDVYIEIDFAGAGPNAQTSGDLVFGESAALEMWIWADEPDIDVLQIFIQANGRSAQGIPENGGALIFDHVGLADPDNHFVFATENGTLNDDQTLISQIFFSNFFMTTDDPLPTSIDDAWLIYTDFSGTALTPGAGVMPIVNLELIPGVPHQTVHTFGLYQTPTPSTLVLLGFGALVSTRRLR